MSLKLTPILICLVTVKLILGQYTMTKSEDCVVTGSSITLTCNTGTNVNSIQWTTPWSSFITSQGSGTSCTGTPPDKYQYSCSGGTIFSLTINNITFSYNGTEWKCEPAFGGGTPSNIVYIYILAPLVKVSITSESTPVKPGILTQLTCSTNPCYPEAVITWTLDGTEITDSITNPHEIINCTEVVTRSSLNKTFNTEDNGKSLVCSATNGEYNVSSNITLDIEAEERSSTNVPTTTPNLGSGSGCNLVCIILITVISVTGFCIIIICCLISLRNQNTKKNDKTTNIELSSKMKTEKSQTEVSVDVKAEENCNIQEYTDTEDVETVKDRIANESSHNMSGKFGSDEDNESSEDYSYNQTNVKPANQPVSKDVCKELTRSEDCQQSVTDSLNKTDVSNNTAESQHPTRQNYNNADHQKTKHITTIDVKIRL